MTVEEAAKMLAAADTCGGDESIMATIAAARRIVSGEADPIEELRELLNRTTTRTEAKSVLLRALAATGAIDDMNDARWQQLSIEELATMVSAIELADGMDESVRAAVRLASKVAQGDAKAVDALAV